MTYDINSALSDLRRSVLTMAAEVELRVNAAFEALVDHDLDKAQSVRTGDDPIDRMELEIEEECLRILALLQPVAGDLRFILAVLRMNHELERMGDLAKSVAKRVLAVGTTPSVELPVPLIDMTTHTKRMLADVLQAFADDDPALAREVRRADRIVDDLQREVFTWVQRQIPEQVEATDVAIDYLSTARSIERIADMARSIAADVVFLTEGDVVRHARLSKQARS